MPTKKKTKQTKPAVKPAKAAKANAAAAKMSKPKVAKAAVPAPAPVETKPKEQVTIARAKGRPMLSWVGKRPLRAVTAFPAQHVESFIAPGADKVPVADAAVWKDWPEKYPRSGLLFHGDNKEVLAHLLANGFRGKVQLIYIDPPFDSGADYVRKVTLRGSEGSAKFEGESYALGEQIQYTDIWANDNYLQFMYERLLLLKELLKENGVIFVHTNHERGHLIRCLLDEVFGPENFRNDIIWKRGPGKAHPSYFGIVKDTILFYCNGPDYIWNKQYTAISEAYAATFRKKDDKDYYVTQPLHSGKPAKNVPEWRGVKPPGGRGWAYKIATLDKFEAEGRIEWSEDGVPRLKRYFHEVKGAVIQDVWSNIADSTKPEFIQAFLDYMDEMASGEDADVWDDIAPVLDRSLDHTGYPTQKPIGLAMRMISACTHPGDLVLDCFAGSAPTLVAAQQFGSRWIGCDINKGAIQTTIKRLQAVITEQLVSAKTASQQQELLAADKPKDAPPAQLGFTVHRVNDYDLAIQHNEAVNLACEHIGVTRTLADAFFDGTLGSKLVKIVPFGHSLSPADLEDVKRELDARANESRDVVVVCLGKELGVDAWLADWNRMRKQGDTPNKIEIIELRSDPKYGKFIAHKPAQARVDIRRVKAKGGDKLVVEVKDFISPSIAERLQDQAGLLAPKIPDWRAMVDSVMIDADHDGQAFKIALADVPERKQDYVQARYELVAPDGKTTVAVKITDMLGEEVIVAQKV